MFKGSLEMISIVFLLSLGFGFIYFILSNHLSGSYSLPSNGWNEWRGRPGVTSSNSLHVMCCFCIPSFINSQTFFRHKKSKHPLPLLPPMKPFRKVAGIGGRWAYPWFASMAQIRGFNTSKWLLGHLPLVHLSGSAEKHRKTFHIQIWSQKYAHLKSTKQMHDFDSFFLLMHLFEWFGFFKAIRGRCWRFKNWPTGQGSLWLVSTKGWLVTMRGSLFIIELS